MLWELNIKNQADLEQYIQKYTQTQKNKPSGFTITCKDNNLDLKIVLKSLTKINKNNIVPCFSCSVMQNYKNLLWFIKVLNKHKIPQFLLVSGDDNSKIFDTLKALVYLKNYQNLNKNYNYNIGVAHNPFLSNQLSKLKQKLNHKTVNSVYLQLGDDLAAIQDSVDQIRSIRKNIQIIGSILIPNLKILQAIQNKPNYGYGYSVKYLNNIEFAKLKTTQIEELYKNLEIEILWSGLTKI